MIPNELKEWEQKEWKVLDALFDGHPNPVSFMEYWYYQNPKPIYNGNMAKRKRKSLKKIRVKP